MIVINVCNPVNLDDNHLIFQKQNFLKNSCDPLKGYRGKTKNFWSESFYLG